MSDAARPTLNGIGWMYKGDLTDHGGVVVEGFEKCTWNDNIPVARLGCKVYCPKCSPHIHTIVEANGFSVHGINFAVENDLTSCGARLLASRASGAHAAIAHAFENGNSFDEQIQFKTSEGKLLINLDYIITLANGEVLSGKTDEAGRSHRIVTMIKTDIIKVVFILDPENEDIQ